MTRRDLLWTASAAAAITAPAAAAAATPQFVKGICSIIFPKAMPRAAAFEQAKKAGFDAIELSVGYDLDRDTAPEELKRLRDAAHDAGIAIATLWVSEPFRKFPLNSDDPAVRDQGIEALRRAIGIATQIGCEALLLYPVRLGSGPKLQYGYEVTWQRLTAELKKAIPDAERAKVYLNPENVWNKFLLSPLEMRSFVDQFHSPWLQTHFDVGNVMQYGYPEDWILTLGSRIKRVHFKDYKLSHRAEQGHFVDLLEGDVNWKAVMSALVKTGYRGPLSPEIEYDPKDPEKIGKVSAALDQILALA
jgi:L-ribulose-5-phosphate 3-epimerase